jgi:hypothetical protein
MKKSTKIVLGILGVVTIAGSIAVSTSLAAEDGKVQNIFSRAAEILGVEEKEMEDAFEQAWQEEVSQLVEEGKITEEQAEKMLEKGFFMPKGKSNRQRPRGARMLHELTEYLEMDIEEIVEQWQETETLAEVIKNNGKDPETVKAYLVDIAQNKIEEALDSGNIDAEKAEELTERTEDMIDKLIYELPAPPRKPAHTEKMKEFDNMPHMRIGDEMPTEGFHNAPLMFDGINES